MARPRLFTRRTDTAAPRRSLTAAATRLRLLDRSTKLPKPAEWQQRAWVVFDEVGQIKGVVRYRANVISRVRMFAGIVLEPGQAPTPIGHALALQQANEIHPVPGLTVQAALDADDLVNRIQSDTGGQAEIMRSLSVNLDVPGECYLIGRESPASAFGEEWEVISIEELRSKGTVTTTSGEAVPQYVIQSDEGEPIRLDPETTVVFRIWRRHDRWRQRADSSLRGILEEAEDYLLLRQGNHAIMSSRIANAGILLRSSHYDLDVYDPRSEDPTNPADVDNVIMEAMETAIRNPRSADAAVPVMLSADVEDVTKIMTRISFDRDFTGADEHATQLIQRMAQGSEAPVERVTGLGESSTFANAALVTEDEYEGYLQPTVLLITSSIGAGWYRPGMSELGYAPSLVRMLEVGADASDAIRDPDRPEHALAAHSQEALSNPALLKYLGFDENDAPTVEELLQRRALKASTDGAITEALLRILAPEFVVPRALPITAGTEIITVEGGEQVAAPTEPAAGPPALVAAAGPPRPTQAQLDRMSRRLAEIDRGVFERILTLADEAVSDALRIAGNRARSTSQGDPQLARLVKDADARDVPAILHRAGHLAALDTGPALDDFSAKYLDIVRRGQASARAAIRPVAPLDDQEEETLVAKQDEDSDAGLALLLLSLGKVVDDATSGVQQIVTQGEIPATAFVSPGMVGESLARAGGETGLTITPSGATVTDLGTRPVAGVAQGPTVVTTVEVKARVKQAQFRWLYGDASSRRTPFEPHENLDGETFAAWDDPVLANDEGWPPDPFYFPRDHANCVPAGTIVSGPAPLAETLRWYEGELIELTTAAGEFLAVTPNHPILTPNGWIPAGLLDEGDHVVRCLDGEAATGLVPCEHQVEARCEDIFASLRVSEGVVTGRVPVAPEDFHGDGADTEIAVVAAYRQLRDDGEAAVVKPTGHACLSVREGTGSFLASGSPPFTGLDAGGLPADGIVSGFGVGLALLGSELGVANELGIRSAPDRDATFLEAPSDRGPADAEILGKSLEGLAPFVAVDEIVHLARRDFEGHVFNLHTEPGWYIAGGIIVHNCQCSFEIIFGDAEE